MKNNNIKKGIISIILILSTIAIGIIFTYPYILNNSTRILEDMEASEISLEKERENEQKENFTDMLFRGNYSLYTDIIRQNTGVTTKPSDIYLPDYRDVLTDDRSDRIEDFNEVLDRWQKNFYDNDMTRVQLEYYIVDNQTGNYLTNTVVPLANLLNGDTEIQNSYSFHGIFSYNSEGKLEIPMLYGLNEENKAWFQTRELTKQLIRQETDYSSWYEYGSLMKGPMNVTIIYAVKSDDFYKYNSYFYSMEDESFHRGGFVYVFFLAFSLVFAASIFLVLRKNWGVMKLSGWIPGEISILGILIPFICYGGLLDIARETAEGNFIGNSDIIINGKMLHILDYLLNYLIWIIVLGIFLMCLISLWQLFTKGIKRYLREKTICGMCYGRIKKFIISLKDIDLRSKSNKSIIKILAVNFIILTVLCSIWVAGILGSFIYSFLLFFIFRKYINNLKKQYQILLNAASKMAEGNLEASVEKDLGVFNPLKEELAKVQYGFKAAVEEEMKSQKMKTELVSNVSHDLKTPLTAIITYIDLLKDHTITEDERDSYIDTLDKKSMRLKKLIEDLFEMSKVNTDNIQLNLVEVDIISLIKQVQLELGDQIAESGVEFRSRFPKDKVILKLDSEKTYRIFENLIINITKYSLPDTRAYIEVTEENNMVLISLKNISATELDFIPEEITERFVRGDKSRNTEGSGLGLAIAKSFAELQGGRLEIQLDGDLFKANLYFQKMNF